MIDLRSYETRMLAMHMALFRLDEISRERAERLANYAEEWKKKWALADFEEDL